MLAAGYLVLVFAAGDTLADILGVRGSRPRRLATAFVTGLLATTWLTYLAALAFAQQPNALELGNLATAGVMFVLVAVRLGWRWSRGTLAVPAWLVARPSRSERLDWLLAGGVAVFSGWMAVSTYGFERGELQIGTLVWSDFGPTTAIAQSFALGHNLPTEYPHFAGPSILYHFLFYFQAGNLTRLGLDPALATNLLSVASTVALLTLVIELGRRLFRSAWVGRTGALLFFFHGSLAFVPYLAGFASPSEAITAIAARTSFLPSGFPYRGEEWGIWTQLVFLNQRHLASAIAILLVGVLFVLDRREAARSAPRREDLGDRGGDRGAPQIWATTGPFDDLVRRTRSGLSDPALPGYLVVGLLLGLLPLWNAPVFTASAVVLGVLFVALPLRPQLACLAVVAALASLPQLAVLRPAEMARTGEFPILHVGYIVDDPTLASVAAYLGFTFGPKLLLAAVALAVGTWLQRLVFGAFSALVALAFLVQFSVEAFANHKFFNIWLVVLNLYAAVGVARLWRLAQPIDWRRSAARLAGRTAAAFLVGVIVAGGLIDLAPVKNGGKIGLHLAGDPLFDWVMRETMPRDVFLTDIYVTHPILLAGRPVYYGWPYYAWSAGYPTGVREDLYRRILAGTSAGEVVGLLRQEGITWVAIDDGMRDRGFVKDLNEPLLASALELAFDDPEGRYGHLAIYRVPAGAVGQPSAGQPGALAPVSMFAGGTGAGPGQFKGPRGIAVSGSGEVFVADSDNHRIQRFGSDGTFANEIGGLGTVPGRFNQPNGVAIGPNGHVYVADTSNHRVQELDAAGRFVQEWHGPEPRFYGPRDVVVTPDGSLYVLDQGRGRVVEIGLDGRMTAFGGLGSGDGQLRDPTGLAVAGGRVYVADTANARISVFTTQGVFVSSVLIPEWNRTTPQYVDLVVSEDGRSLYASSFATDEILVLGLDGRRLGTIRATPPNRFQGPGAMTLRPGGGLYVVEFYGARITAVMTAQ
jgi:DNA-binding beta-propeller fold protein YncE